MVARTVQSLIERSVGALPGTQRRLPIPGAPDVVAIAVTTPKDLLFDVVFVKGVYGVGTTLSAPT